jgi:hypothetical protein
MTTRTWQKAILPFAFVLLLLALSLSCNLSAPASNQADPTLTAMSASIAGTTTAEAEEGDDTAQKLETAQANATATSQAVAATQTSRAANRSEAQIATSTVAAPILAELPFYGVDVNLGHVGWITATETISITGFQQSGFVIAPVTAADFVLAADIHWDTQYGSSGCGFMFRSDGDQNKPNAYMILATRFATGHVIFTALAKGELANLHDFFPKTNDRSFQWENGTTNRLAIVARGNIIEIYSNTAKIAEIDTTQPPTPIKLPPPPAEPLDKKDEAAMNKYLKDVEEYQEIVKKLQDQYNAAVSRYNNQVAIYTNGFLGFMALSESGRTQCKFENAWLWVIDQ